MSPDDGGCEAGLISSLSALSLSAAGPVGSLSSSTSESGHKGWESAELSDSLWTSRSASASR